MTYIFTGWAKTGGHERRLEAVSRQAYLRCERLLLSGKWGATENFNQEGGLSDLCLRWIVYKAGTKMKLARSESMQIELDDKDRVSRKPTSASHKELRS